MTHFSTIIATNNILHVKSLISVFEDAIQQSGNGKESMTRLIKVSKSDKSSSNGFDQLPLTCYFSGQFVFDFRLMISLLSCAV